MASKTLEVRSARRQPPHYLTPQGSQRQPASITSKKMSNTFVTRGFNMTMTSEPKNGIVRGDNPGDQQVTRPAPKRADPGNGEFFNNGNYAKAVRSGGTFPPEAERPKSASANFARTDTPLAREPFRLVLGG
jgi:hypothetical protein